MVWINVLFANALGLIPFNFLKLLKKVMRELKPHSKDSESIVLYSKYPIVMSRIDFKTLTRLINLYPDINNDNWINISREILGLLIGMQ